MTTPIKTKKLLWHLTDINNLENILKKGLISRNDVYSERINISDVADQDIIAKRKEKGLLDYVPFHFFVNNPFDGKVLIDNPDKDFCYISISRAFAEKNNFKILKRHPLSDSDNFEKVEPLPYTQGFEQIDWNTLEKRNYSDDKCKSVCMAEALSPLPINYSDFFSIAVYNNKDKDRVVKIIDSVLKDGYSFHIDVEPSYFSARNR